LTHYRIDEFHSNAYAEWLRMGSPSEPNEKQYTLLQTAGALAALGPVETLSVAVGRAMVSFDLPRQAVSLLTIEW
jgi:xylan 1,4-beta-xylosidase